MVNWSDKFKTLKTRAQGRLLALTVLLLSTTLVFQNCGQFVPLSQDLISGVTFGSSGGGDLQPGTDKLDPDCGQSSDYDACIFYKNPVAQARQALNTPLMDAAVDNLQIYGVKLTGLLPTGHLENGTISVESVTGTPVVTQQRVRFAARGDSSHGFSQVMAYYWLNRATEYIEARTGKLYSKGRAIHVFADDTLSGWSSRTNSIHLKLGDDRNPMAWSAELAIHFLGLAEVHYASSGAINAVGSDNHQDCGLKANGCCRTQVGCARAIASGIGDYYAAMMFPTLPTIGESWSNSVSGMGQCSRARDLNAAASLTASAAYGACAAQNASGETSTLGLVYASIWWEVRKKARTFATAGDRDIDGLFVAHLATLRGDDTFQTALNKIKALDAQKYGGIYSQLFVTEFANRGL